MAGGEDAAFANVTYVILKVGQRRPLPHGEVGELCIGGVHVARGYRSSILNITNVIVYVLLYPILLRLDASLVVSALVALIFTEVFLVLSSAAIKKLLVGKKWGSANSTPPGPGETSPTSSHRTATLPGVGSLWQF